MRDILEVLWPRKRASSDLPLCKSPVKVSGTLTIGGLMQIDRSSLPSSKEAIDAFPSALIEIVQQHRPSRMPFFRHVRSLSLPVASDPDFLGDVHLIYQA